MIAASSPPPAPQAVILDVEGTTTTIDFVHRILFSIARRDLPEFVERHFDDPRFQGEMELVRLEAALHFGVAAAAVTHQQASALLVQMVDEDRKDAALKSLQGEIWRDAFARGGLRAHVYPDVRPALARWKARGLQLYIYSSGSVAAQRLLFSHSIDGDLTPLLDGYFDTAVGRKREPESYRRIAEAIALPPGAALFLSDIVEELDAARAAGMATAWLFRDGAVPPAEPRHPTATSFDALLL